MNACSYSRTENAQNSVVFVGTMSPWKGVHTLRAALVRVSREIPEVTLDVAVIP